MHMLKKKTIYHSIATDCNVKICLDTTTCTIQSNKLLKTATDNMVMSQGIKILLNDISYSYIDA